MKLTEKAYHRRLPQSEQPGAGLIRELRPRAPQEDQPALRLATIKDSHYLEFLRERPCCICLRWGVRVEPHHLFKQLAGISYAGIGQKGSDLLAIPVCRECHIRFHSGALRLSREDALQLILVNLVQYLLNLESAYPNGR